MGYKRLGRQIAFFVSVFFTEAPDNRPSATKSPTHLGHKTLVEWVN